jgi:hypothetical protein
MELASSVSLPADVKVSDAMASDAKTPIEAEFYLVFTPDGSRNAQVSEVKFIKGSDSLKAVTSELKKLKYKLVFPDSSPTKIIRRGTLSCTKAGACTLTFVSPDLITSVD